MSFNTLSISLVLIFCVYYMQFTGVFAWVSSSSGISINKILRNHLPQSQWAVNDEAEDETHPWRVQDGVRAFGGLGTRDCLINLDVKKVVQFGCTQKVLVYTRGRVINKKNTALLWHMEWKDGLLAVP